MTTIHIGRTAHVKGNAFQQDQVLHIESRGALVIGDDGRIVETGPAENYTHETHPDAVFVHHGEDWLLPGFVDGHIHFPQVDATAAPGEQLLDWLQHSIFTAEMKFNETAFAREAADVFCKELLRNGTTSALVFGSQFPQATQALFDAAQRLGLRVTSGITLMDRNSRDELYTPADTAYQQNVKLIRYIADKPMLNYAVTPRFAISCSDELLEVSQALLQAYPNCLLQTHINENQTEIKETLRLFPDARDYLSVYSSRGLVTERTVLAHNIHARKRELDRMSELGCSVCHCPSSNMYLGSGLFPMKRHIKRNIPVLMGTDVGAGRRFSILEELGEGYNVSKLRGFTLTAAQLLYLGTLAGAQALHQGHLTGNFAHGKAADFVVLSAEHDAYLRRRLNACKDLEEQLLIWLLMGRPEHLTQTYTNGNLVHSRPLPSI